MGIRGIGIIIAPFIVFQAGNGLLITISEFGDTPPHSSEGHEHAEQGEGASASRKIKTTMNHTRRQRRRFMHPQRGIEPGEGIIERRDT